MIAIGGRKTITITSGKSGVGKSSIVSNMAYVLENMNKSTFILDANLSVGNKEQMSGRTPKFNAKDVMEGTKNIEEIIAKGPCGIKIIPATSGIREFSKFSENEKNMFFSFIQELPEYDYLIVDTSADISTNVVYFNVMSQGVFIVLTPDPSSINDSYAVIEVLHKKTGRKDFNIIVNMVKDEKEALEIFKNIVNVTDKFLDVYLDYFGYIPLDKKISDATRKQELWVEHFPDTCATQALVQICKRLVS
ncbi:MAG: Cobyrinic acid a,c-diamide synthase [Deltaproteobacteria bacterium]|nr:Cobyrinic acid a,c-diamide synthase [Deltaproteobacteria bacterium]